MEDGGIDDAVREIRERSNGHMVQETMITQTFHIANIQNILTKTETGERGMFLRKIDKMGFLRDQCKDEEPLFLVYSETCLKKSHSRS